MVDIERFKKLDRLAIERSNQGGRRISFDPGFTAFLTAVATYLILMVFVGLDGLSQETAFLPMMIVIGITSGIAFLVVRSQHKAWSERYARAFRELDHDEQV